MENRIFAPMESRKFFISKSFSWVASLKFSLLPMFIHSLDVFVDDDYYYHSSHVFRHDGIVSPLWEMCLILTVGPWK